MISRESCCALPCALQQRPLLRTVPNYGPRYVKREERERENNEKFGGSLQVGNPKMEQTLVISRVSSVVISGIRLSGSTDLISDLRPDIRFISGKYQV